MREGSDDPLHHERTLIHTAIFRSFVGGELYSVCEINNTTHFNNSVKYIHLKSGRPKVCVECKIKRTLGMENLCGKGRCVISYGNVFTLNQTQMLKLGEGEVCNPRIIIWFCLWE